MLKQSFDNLMAQIDASANGVQRDRGTMFEEVVKSYLLNEPAYKNLYTDVWLLQEVPAEYHIPKKDLGVDLVARYRDSGALTAVQAKYYRGKVGKDTINSYVAELNKNYYADGLLVTTTDDWNKNAEAALDDGSKHITRIGLSDLKHSSFDWSQFHFGNATKSIQASHKQPRGYQKDAIAKAVAYFDAHERGKLIMAPGTGKTFTSLKIAEAMAQHEYKQDYFVLYLVPSIQLLSQTLFSWNSDVNPANELISFAVTSDRNASKKRTYSNNDDNSDMNIQDIGFPASTNADKLMANFAALKPTDGQRITVIFSTYQSIDVIHQAQEQGYPEFDLIIADEAHRTTGAHAANTEAGMFTKVHSNNTVKAKHRLYQTATPKIYSQDTKKKGEEDNIVISSMDDKNIYGEEIFRLGFGDAVAQGILTDYKVEVLAVDESVIQRDMQNSLSTENGLNIDDIGKIIGVWNAMMKRESFSNKVSGKPMQRAIAFASVIDNQRGHGAGKVGSKQVAREFNHVVNEYLGKDNPNSFHVHVKHVDGSMNALQKKDAIDWLASDLPDDEARLLSNVKFLTEGIDVPSLDAIIFFAPKQSQIDIVQAVGRIMRKYKDKEYGYIILPVVVPTGQDPDTVLDDNKTYQAVWQVLNALRSIDERFEASVNKLDLNKKKPGNLNVIGVGGAPDNDFNRSNQRTGDEHGTEQTELELNWHEIQDAIYGRIVKKVGDRRYLEDWTADVQKLAERHIRWIENLIADKKSPFAKSFRRYVKSLQHNINSDIDDEQAIEMLAQHVITKPIFEALFDQYSFVNDNPVSRAMEDMIEQMMQAGFDQEQAVLKPFYESVRTRATGIDNAAAKQQFIVTLYDKFFSTGFSATAEKLGIVFTPVEIVDFIVKSVDEVLKEHFGCGLDAENVHILDPFTGTGTFITRTLAYLNQEMQAGKITLADITRKYTQELHANEIVLLSYYIAAINIESVFDEINGTEAYIPFDGIVLTDTFESTENSSVLDEDMFGGNNKRLQKQQKVPITAIISNPPYSVGQRNQNDDNQNVHYKKLEKRIADTYVKNSSAGLTGGLYDSYIKAFRWASDRLGKQGVIGFVTNGGFLDSQSASGLRKSFYEEFNYLYIYNLRGNQRTQGEKSRKEGGKIFGSGSRAPIAISILIKDGSNEHHLYYKDIGDYLTRQQKFDAISNAASVNGIEWTELTPDKNNDWLNQRNENYKKYMAISAASPSVFKSNAIGAKTNRDTWLYGFSRTATYNKANLLTEHYKQELRNGTGIPTNRDGKYIKWSPKLEQLLRKGQSVEFDENNIRLGLYRPYTKKYLYYDNKLVERPGLYYKQFGDSNEVIFTTGRGASKDFSVLATDLIPDIQLLMNGQGFMRYNNESSENDLVPPDRDNVSTTFAAKLGLNTDETYAYVYGLLNSPEYQQKYANDLKKDLARIPIVKDVHQYVEIGQQLFELHINYEDAEPYAGCKVTMHADKPSYRVQKMRFKSRKDHSVIKFNSDITISDIPARAYDYVVNGRSAIEWIMDQYRVKTDKVSQITDDPNDYSDDPQYILNLLLSVITVSMKTLELIDKLPKFEIIERDDR
ncbi:type ISP restriction/modification enzyme [Lactiplantibacillus plantarum]|uniref:type ISP restriction/modification enzyme n=1 Tax=Lactiplantibacillus plantarum TaxID=1590 RepID=UPI0007B5441F|nr:type ISP restriction/modification enzyme [Lactiplantibacillus plantarum]KZU41314.1 putative helicase [Lactiplantibacillus plantarum]KZU47122.1 putative helicase [Lactiplantibacillus plantarum]